MGNTFAYYVPPATYTFVPDRCPHNVGSYGRVTMSGHAEDWLYTRCSDIPLHTFYLTSAPCPDCAVKLLDKYNLMGYKPTIYIGRPYIGKGKSGYGSKNVNLRCLAMLVQNGFKLKAWKWSSFIQYLTNYHCRNAMYEMFSPQWGDLYIRRYWDTVNTLTYVNNMAASGTNFENLCRGILYYGCYTFITRRNGDANNLISHTYQRIHFNMARSIFNIE